MFQNWAWACQHLVAIDEVAADGKEILFNTD
jgi:hypothetical protein